MSEHNPEWQLNSWNSDCQCGDPEFRNGPNHSCPFRADVHNDDTPNCKCCDSCQHECSMDI